MQNTPQDQPANHEQQHTIQFCPVMQNTFTYEELMYLEKQGIVQYDKEGRINAIVILTDRYDYEVYTDSKEAQQEKQAIIRLLNKGQRISKQKLLKHLSSSKSRVSEVQYIQIDA